MFRIAICDDENYYRDRLGDILKSYAVENNLEFDILYFEFFYEGPDMINFVLLMFLYNN